MERIAILATGDEIVNGDITNTNGQTIARTLIDNHLQPGNHMAVNDEQHNITHAIQHLIKDHAALITIGGLGPTSDDRTRFALAEAVDKPLVFDSVTWQKIVTRLTELNLDIPESNRQQCLFPEGARILPNKNGTAAACLVEYNGKMIFMLPGPPKECLPLFEQYVLPQLLKSNLVQPTHHAHWLLLGVSEGSIAEKIDQLNTPISSIIGYRVDHPYIEVKLKDSDADHFQQAQNAIQQIVTPHLISRNKQTALEQLITTITKQQLPITIIDEATQGTLRHHIINAETAALITFAEHSENHNSTEKTIVHLQGLNELWDDMVQSPFSKLFINVYHDNKEFTLTKSLPNRGNKTRRLATELTSWEILKILLHS
ncbi:MAG: competence/damage-inducible protein A [Gammaproteobacteria bacterium]|nr:competence/damage-inducible protein A [Gammaproteobacteria bacterium]MCH9743873.1 competence/damage-inducible protein A [Gammaproteobacteria bacterium]